MEKPILKPKAVHVCAYTRTRFGGKSNLAPADVIGGRGPVNGLRFYA